MKLFRNYDDFEQVRFWRYGALAAIRRYNPDNVSTFAARRGQAMEP